MSKFIARYFPIKENIRKTLFNCITLVGMIGGWIALIFTLYAGATWIQIASVLVTEVVLNLSFYLANSKEKLDLGAFLIVSVITFLCFPVMFFSGGGMNGGMPCWLVIGMVFNIMLNEGKIAYIIMVIQIIINSACCYISYIRPELVTPLENDYGPCMDIIQSIIVVGVGIGLIIRFQVNAYKGALETNIKQNAMLEEANILAESANRAKSDFLANMSHELRTPINAILGMNEMILRETNEQNIITYANDVHIASETVLALINEILDISKIENGKLEIINSKYDLRVLMRNCYVMISPRAKAKNLAFKVENDESVPTFFNGDEFHIREVIINLLTNAVKYTKTGEITLAVKGEKCEDGKYYLSISVSDTGIGIKKEDLGNLFDMFQRVDLDKNRTIEGTGLGLAITKSLVELMGGEILVESVYGKGSTFTVRIPQQIEDETPIGNLVASFGEYKEQNAKKSSNFKAKGVRALVVDDVEMNIKVVGLLLSKAEMEVDKALSGFECLEKVKSNKYDIIFLDHMMPEMDGIETRKKMMEMEDCINKDTPVIMLTANAITGAKEEYLSKGFCDYLTKPVVPQTLEEMIRKYTM